MIATSSEDGTGELRGDVETVEVCRAVMGVGSGKIENVENQTTNE
jgi:hypothetical protein